MNPSLPSLLLIGLILALGNFRAGAETSNASTYLKIYLEMSAAEKSSKKGDYAGALTSFQDCITQLTALRQRDPDWEEALVFARLRDATAIASDLQKRIRQEAASTYYTTTMPATAPAPAPPATGPMVDPVPVRTKVSYPWKMDVLTSKFWIGETPNQPGSAWVPDLTHQNGGKDNPEYRNGYASGDHAPRANPFYISLPFNDLTHPEEAKKWVPAAWARKPKEGKPVSWCKDRWVQIKNKQGRSCYAQWEDVGPGGSDAGSYVFGPDGVPSPGKPGLGISPAVAQYLGIDGSDTTSWRFVDEEDVRPGEWLKYDELGIIYLAMHEQEGSKNSTAQPAMRNWTRPKDFGSPGGTNDWSTGEEPAKPAKTP